MSHSRETACLSLSNFSRSLARAFVPFLLVIFFLPFFILPFYSSPATDDFCKATLSFNTVPQSDVLTVTWMYYTKWSPRWLSTFLESIIMSHVNLVTMYSWLLWLVMIATIASLWFFFRTVFGMTRGTSLLISGVFYSSWIVGIASPAPQLYWLTGAIEYMLPLSAMLVLFSLLQSARRVTWYYIAISLLSIAIPAEHEVAGTFLCAILLAGVLIMRAKKLPAHAWYLLVWQRPLPVRRS